jgi:hypothetical protein
MASGHVAMTIQRPLAYGSHFIISPVNPAVQEGVRERLACLGAILHRCDPPMWKHISLLVGHPKP